MNPIPTRYNFQFLRLSFELCQLLLENNAPVLLSGPPNNIQDLLQNLHRLPIDNTIVVGATVWHLAVLERLMFELVEALGRSNSNRRLLILDSNTPATKVPVNKPLHKTPPMLHFLNHAQEKIQRLYCVLDEITDVAKQPQHKASVMDFKKTLMVAWKKIEETSPQQLTLDALDAFKNNYSLALSAMQKSCAQLPFLESIYQTIRQLLVDIYEGIQRGLNLPSQKPYDGRFFHAYQTPLSMKLKNTPDLDLTSWMTEKVANMA